MQETQQPAGGLHLGAENLDARSQAAITRHDRHRRARTDKPLRLVYDRVVAAARRSHDLDAVGRTTPTGVGDAIATSTSTSTSATSAVRDGPRLSLDDHRHPGIPALGAEAQARGRHPVRGPG